MRLLLAIALLIPTLGAIVVRVGSPVESLDASPAVDRPSLVFSQYLVHLRNVEPSRHVTAVYRYRNNGAEDVRITATKPSCGCLQPRLTRDLLKPGETGEILVRIDTALQSTGFHEYTVDVHFEDSRPRQQQLVFRVDLPRERIAIRPRSIMFYTGGASVQQTVSLYDYRIDPLSIVRIEGTIPGLSATVGEAEIDGDGTHRIPIEVKVEQAPSKPVVDATIRIVTNDEDYPELMVPVRVMQLPAEALRRPMESGTSPAGHTSP